MGDAERNPDTQAPAAPPSLRKLGEKLPGDNQNVGVMRPVQPPKPKPAPQPDADAAGEPAAGTSQSPPEVSGPAKPSSPPAASQPQ
jgi:hypothetical protein